MNGLQTGEILKESMQDKLKGIGSLLNKVKQPPKMIDNKIEAQNIETTVK